MYWFHGVTVHLESEGEFDIQLIVITFCSGIGSLFEVTKVVKLILIGTCKG